MSARSAIIIFRIKNTRLAADLEVPLDISAHELVLALNEAFDLGIDTSDARNCFMKASYPTALLQGSRSLAGFGIRTGSVISHES